MSTPNSGRSHYFGFFNSWHVICARVKFQRGTRIDRPGAVRAEIKLTQANFDGKDISADVCDFLPSYTFLLVCRNQVIYFFQGELILNITL